ncbi:MAG TPA: hypothetical protein VLH15_09345 [Dehalococcoidales bacterium]|nr:hypothetical protein [Dehalococcoidales bacterium]
MSGIKQTGYHLLRRTGHPKALFFILTAALLASLLAGCATANSLDYDYTPDAGTAIIKISDILEQPSNFQGKEVVLKGKIGSQCRTGCWFYLNDGSGEIYVDLAPSNLAIPQKRGATVVVLGEVIQKSGHIYIIGKRLGF